jgi:large subunit ribosomal protein L25
MEMNDDAHAVRAHAPDGRHAARRPEETVIATITPPTLEPVEDEIETETALVGEDGEPLEGEAEAEGERRGRAAEAASSSDES